MKILFIGCVKSSERFLQAIYHKTTAELIGVVTKIESKYNADHVALDDFCDKKNIDWLNYENNEQLLNWVKQKNPDIIYCFGWSYLLPKEIYSLPPLGAIGYHPTLLPKNRGRHPIIWTLVLGLKETGSTFFYLTDIPDAGDILSQKRIVLEDSEDANSLYEKLLTVGEQQVVDMTNNIMSQTITPITQDEQQATYWRKRSKIDGEIDWRMNAKTILQLIKALTKPYVGAHFQYNNMDITIWRAKVLESHDMDNIEPGKIVNVNVNDNSFMVKTADKLLQILEYEGDFIPKEGEYL
ncbi:formyl transferase [Lysinibacillus sphaericus]|uniref:formyltransferase family protein n=1 Tax=Lysinibacillus sphaericus TaxID=1421 RepID=UPI002161D8F3|nr:formyltransferase family protein [Lysinibacillus sphaericus]MCS1383978.1 formyl transferase [Lysinibacillus sphaericus]